MQFNTISILTGLLFATGTQATPIPVNFGFSYNSSGNDNRTYSQNISLGNGSKLNQIISLQQSIPQLPVSEPNVPLAESSDARDDIIQKQAEDIEELRTLVEEVRERMEGQTMEGHESNSNHRPIRSGTRHPGGGQKSLMANYISSAPWKHYNQPWSEAYSLHTSLTKDLDAYLESKLHDLTDSAYALLKGQCIKLSTNFLGSLLGLGKRDDLGEVLEDSDSIVPEMEMDEEELVGLCLICDKMEEMMED
ncbi:hypothetical protein BJ508DRAFT_376235 [Ascobolus immersus RN42]|uniref:Uncharacterized protein n=1 Tax=Ascobolus immersus RN42 TaxID=1160509 RepID=A0A3N4ICK1_ASCIM|nr:hypothetical protein BJ508DRAFT_376235 [Ascobolus immersus RN42]